jgi:hypothetical protein
LSKTKVELIQDELKKAVGPIGSFIVEKQIKDMNENKDNFPDDKLPILIERSVENGIFDPTQRRSIATKMKRNINLMI